MLKTIGELYSPRGPYAVLVVCFILMDLCAKELAMHEVGDLGRGGATTVISDIVSQSLKELLVTIFRILLNNNNIIVVDSYAVPVRVLVQVL